METDIDIKAIRMALSLTLRELGVRLGGVHRTTVGRWERGEARVSGPARLLLERLRDEARAASASTKEAA